MADIKVHNIDTIECGGETITGAELRQILTKRVMNPDGDIVRIDGRIYSVPTTRRALRLFDEASRILEGWPL